MPDDKDASGLDSIGQLFEGFILRDARPEDKREVLQFTAHTWEFGDYIEYVYDDWLADRSGRFIVLEEVGSGRIAAIDKLSFLTENDAWFEGLRVRPDFRGRGLASRLQRYMINEARARGALALRFLTLIGNAPVHRMAYRDGFARLFVARFWKWTDLHSSGSAGRAVTGPEVHTLRAARSSEAPHLFDWWQRTSAFLTHGLLNCDWSFGAATVQNCIEGAAQERLFTISATDVSHDALPQPSVLVLADVNHEGLPLWVISMATALGDEWAPLFRGLVNLARERGVDEINGLLPDTVEVYQGMKAADFVPESDAERLCVFALDLHDGE